jgi:hypothetical protein
MDYTSIIKRSPKILIGIALGASLMCGVGRFPILVELNWGIEGNHLKFDSRNGDGCKVTETLTR